MRCTLQHSKPERGALGGPSRAAAHLPAPRQHQHPGVHIGAAAPGRSLGHARLAKQADQAASGALLAAGWVAAGVCQGVCLWGALA